MHTNNTPHYNLPQFIGSDIPNPLTDWNDSMQDIDTAMYEIKTQADEIGSDIVQDESDISDLQSQANLTDDNITLLNQQTTAARSAATDAQDAANRNAANITTLQQSVTNNRTSITQYNNRFNQNVPFAFGIEEVEDPDNPGQMIEQYGYYTDSDPAVFVPFGEAPIANNILIGACLGTYAGNVVPSPIPADIYNEVNFTYLNGVFTCTKACTIHVIINASGADGSHYLLTRCNKNGVSVLENAPSDATTWKKSADIQVAVGDEITFTPVSNNPAGAINCNYIMTLAVS